MGRFGLVLRLDDDAIHDNVGGEIAAITEKTEPAAADIIIIEDSAASNAKKMMQLGSLLPGFTVESMAILTHETAYNVHGGDVLSGAWRTGPLTTEVSDSDNIVSLSGNQFTLAAGTYLIDWHRTVYAATNHAAWLYNATDGTGVGEPVTAYGAGQSHVGTHLITIADSKAFELQGQVTTNQTTNGWGVAHGYSGRNNVFARVVIYKLKELA